jgi:hypothetical protein
MTGSKWGQDDDWQVGPLTEWPLRAAKSREEYPGPGTHQRGPARSRCTSLPGGPKKNRSLGTGYSMRAGEHSPSSPWIGIVLLCYNMQYAV